MFFSLRKERIAFSETPQMAAIALSENPIFLAANSAAVSIFLLASRDSIPTMFRIFRIKKGSIPVAVTIS